ncbi:MAG: hypothetical protein PHD70_14220 [Anaerostipes sp.]|nr:hypothetical protein [Anaerostipes sp.]
MEFIDVTRYITAGLILLNIAIEIGRYASRKKHDPMSEVEKSLMLVRIYMFLFMVLVVWPSKIAIFIHLY